MGTEGQEKEPANIHDVEARKNAFMAEFEARHGLSDDELEAKANAEEADAKEQLAEDSASPAVKEEQEVSPDKEAPVQMPKAEDKKSSGPEGYVRKEALDEERSRRKRLSQKTKDLEARLKELESKLTVPAATQSEDTAEENLTEKERALLEENRRLKAEQMNVAAKEEQETAAQKQARIAKQVSEVDRELREEGFPGFRLGAGLVDQKLKEMLRDEEIDDHDYLDPKMWKRVYKEHVHSEVAQEFGVQTKRDVQERKTKAKENAAKVAPTGGAKDDVKKQSNEEDEEYSAEKERAEFFKFKRDSAPKLRY